MAGITKLFKADLDPARVAAIIFEPVQGEGGFYPAPKEAAKQIAGRVAFWKGVTVVA